MALVKLDATEISLVNGNVNHKHSKCPKLCLQSYVDLFLDLKMLLHSIYILYFILSQQTFGMKEMNRLAMKLLREIYCYCRDIVIKISPLALESTVSKAFS